MTNSFQNVVLGPEAAAFVRGRLAVGNTLARALSDHDLVPGGECVTRLPEAVDRSAVLRFKEGGITDGQHSIRWIVAEIVAYLSSGSDRIVVFEDALSRRGDAVLERLQAPVRYYGGEVYRVLGAADASEHAIETTISESDSPHQFVCVFTRHAEAAGDSDVVDIPDDEILAWAQKATAVIVGAYDAEGFILCRGRQ